MRQDSRKKVCLGPCRLPGSLARFYMFLDFVLLFFAPFAKEVGGPVDQVKKGEHNREDNA